MCEPFRDATGDAEHAERDDERNDTQRRDDDAVQHADDTPRRTAGKQRHRGDIRADHKCGDDTGERDRRADRKIDASADDDHRHSDAPRATMTV